MKYKTLLIVTLLSIQSQFCGPIEINQENKADIKPETKIVYIDNTNDNENQSINRVEIDQPIEKEPEPEIEPDKKPIKTIVKEQKIIEIPTNSNNNNNIEEDTLMPTELAVINSNNNNVIPEPEPEPRAEFAIDVRNDLYIDDVLILESGFDQTWNDHCNCYHQRMYDFIQFEDYTLVVGESVPGFPAETEVYIIAYNDDMTIHTEWADNGISWVRDMAHVGSMDKDDTYLYLRGRSNEVDYRVSLNGNISGVVPDE